MEVASRVGGNKPAEPSAGDLSVCLNCGELLQFNDILVLKLLPSEQIALLDAQPKQLLEKVSKLIKERGRFE